MIEGLSRTGMRTHADDLKPTLSERQELKTVA